MTVFNFLSIIDNLCLCKLKGILWLHVSATYVVLYREYKESLIFNLLIVLSCLNYGTVLVFTALDEEEVESVQHKTVWKNGDLLFMPLARATFVKRYTTYINVRSGSSELQLYDESGSFLGDWRQTIVLFLTHTASRLSVEVIQ
jgi:hypothetical protein